MSFKRCICTLSSKRCICTYIHLVLQMSFTRCLCTLSFKTMMYLYTVFQAMYLYIDTSRLANVLHEMYLYIVFQDNDVSVHCLYIVLQDKTTGWRRLIGSPKLQIIFHKRATKYRALLRKMTYKDKGSYESSPPCRYLTCILSSSCLPQEMYLYIVLQDKVRYKCTDWSEDVSVHCLARHD